MTLNVFVRVDACTSKLSIQIVLLCFKPTKHLPLPIPSDTAILPFLALNFVYIEHHCLPVKVQDKEVDFWHLSFKIMEIILFTPGLLPGIRLSFCWRQFTYALMSI